MRACLFVLPWKRSVNTPPFATQLLQFASYYNVPRAYYENGCKLYFYACVLSFGCWFDFTTVLIVLLPPLGRTSEPQAISEWPDRKASGCEAQVGDGVQRLSRIYRQLYECSGGISSTLALQWVICDHILGCMWLCQWPSR